MAKVNQVQAARLVGKHRKTIWTALQRGRITRDPNGLIDTADLVASGLATPEQVQEPLIFEPRPSAYDRLESLTNRLEALIHRLEDITRPNVPRGAATPPRPPTRRKTPPR